MSYSNKKHIFRSQYSGSLHMKDSRKEVNNVPVTNLRVKIGLYTPIFKCFPRLCNHHKCLMTTMNQTIHCKNA